MEQNELVCPKCNSYLIGYCGCGCSCGMMACISCGHEWEAAAVAKYNEHLQDPEPDHHPTRAKGGRHLDARIRAKGFSIWSRPNVGEPVWCFYLRGAVVKYRQSEVVRLFLKEEAA